MKYKGLVVICLIICLFTISTACAGEIENETNDLISYENNVLITEDSNDDFNIGSNDNVFSQDIELNQENSVQKNDLASNNLGETEYDSYDSLQYLLTAYDVIKLEKNYKRAENEADKEYMSHSIRSTISIDGQGHIIDSNYGKSLFDFYTQDASPGQRSLTIMNCNFINSDFGIRFNGPESININIINCTFTNITNNGVYIHSYCESFNSANRRYFSNANITNCNFVKNSHGLYFETYNSGEGINCNYNIQNCSFIENIASSIESIFNGAKLTTKLNLSNSCFKNNNVNGDGGAIKINNNGDISEAYYYLNIDNSTFINNLASKNGGAIYLYSVTGITINKSKFYQNSANKGASIYVGGLSSYSFQVNKTLFIDNLGVNDDGIYLTADQSNFLYDSYVRDSILLNEKNSNPIIYCHNEININNNWWGNTFEDMQKPRELPENWLVLNLTVDKLDVKEGDYVKIICNLSNIVDFRGKISEYIISDFDLTFNLVMGNNIIDTINVSNGFGETNYLVNGESQNSLKITLGSFEKIFNLNIEKNNQSSQNDNQNANKQTNSQKTTPKISLVLKSVKVKKSAKKLLLQATLKQGNKALSGKKITFKFNGKKYTAKTNKKGIAKVTIKKNVLKKLKVGKKVKYQASYGKKAIVKKTAKVKK